MLPVIFIGSMEISSYWMMIFVGMIVMLCITMKRREEYGLSLLSCMVFTVLLTVCGVLGAKILYCLENIQYVLENGIPGGGLSFFGSVFLIPVFMLPLGLLFRLKPRQTLALCAPNVAAMIGCIRVGCFLSGCCGGWLVNIGRMSFHWPTQAMESVGDFLILSVLLELSRNENFDTRQSYPIFLVSYGILRFFVEFLRDTKKGILFMSNGNWFALLSIAVGLCSILVLKRTSQKEEV